MQKNIHDNEPRRRREEREKKKKEFAQSVKFIEQFPPRPWFVEKETFREPCEHGEGRG